MAFVAIIALINVLSAALAAGLVLHMPRWSPFRLPVGPIGVGDGG